MPIPKVIFFFDEPPRVNDSVIKGLAEKWNNEVILILKNELRKERQEWGWVNPNLGKTRIKYIVNQSIEGVALDSYFKNNKEAIFIFNGFKSATSLYLNVVIKVIEDPRIIVMSERPGIYGNLPRRIIKKILLPLEQRYFYFKYNKYVKSLLPLGQKGSDIFEKYGWSKSKIFPFLYNPSYSNNKTITNLENSDKNKMTNERVKLVYVGRFSKYTKGTKFLRKSIDLLTITENWELALIGGYGDDTEALKKWAATKENVYFKGYWKSTEIVNNLKEYDVVLVPSKFDGWNVVINEAIQAGLAVITTDEAVSHELVQYSNNGYIVQYGDTKRFANKILNMINNCRILENKKNNSVKYKQYLNEELIADYFKSILLYSFDLSNIERPDVPWKI